jgi:hypothetical protein
MKTVETIGFTRCLFAAFLASLCAGVAAGQPPLAFHPGDTVTVAFTFDGKDADRIESGIAYFALPSNQLLEDQAGFRTELGFGTPSHKPGSNTLELSFKLLSNVATGTYRLTQLRASNGGQAPVEIIYNTGLPEYSIRVENPERFVKPAIKSVRDVSKR